jgi:hypothetical protein
VTVAETREQDLRRRKLLGRGLACPLVAPGVDIGRDLALARGPGGLDLVTVEGADNLGQCLAIAVTTALGSDVFNSEFGFDGVAALVEETEPVLVRERVRVSLIRLLGRDARVRRIVDLKLVDRRLESPGAAGTAAGLGRTLEVQVAFETVAGDRAVVDLGRLTTDG